MITIKSKTLQNYYGEQPYDYELKFIHYNIDIAEESDYEYNLFCQDIKNIREYIKDDFLIYFADVYNLEKVYKNTNIINDYENDIYVRIRNNMEYKNYKKINLNLNLIIEIEDLSDIDLCNDKIIIQIDKISELSLEKLGMLTKKYSVNKVIVGQIAYITEEHADLLDELANIFNIDKSNQLELEKNNKIANDIYDVSTYKQILNEINKIIDNCKENDNITTFINMFNYIAENVKYNEKDITEINSKNHNLIGPIFNKKSACEGYSKLLQQVCSLINIESIIVSGGGAKEDGGHVWNQVLIDGIWYNADVTAQSYAKHNNEDWNLCLVSDDCLRYKATSPFRRICSKNYNVN